MDDFKKDFESFDGHIWLNAASEGPLPLIAAKALEEAIVWKSKPYQLDIPKFVSTQKELKRSIGRLIGVPFEDVILANSASYGLHILSNGISWKKGDEIILMHNDFPADILPWLALEQKGVIIRQIKVRNQVLQPDELKEHVTKQTRLLCVSHVHTFSGVILDIDQLSDICKNNDILFILNITQSVGTMPIDLSRCMPDAIVAAGYKWLCGPYGTGFCWIDPKLRDQLILNRAYWPTALSVEELQGSEVLAAKDIKSARKYDVFGTANFFNFVPFKEAIDYWLDIGLENVKNAHDRLIDCFVSELDNSRYQLISPKKGKSRSSLVYVSHQNKNKNKQIFNRLVEQKIYPAYWKGNIRIAAHIYNTQSEMKSTAMAFNKMG